jgi:hypothetical protein
MEQKRLKQNKGKNSEHNTTQNIKMGVEKGWIPAINLDREDADVRITLSDFDFCRYDTAYGP